MSTSLHVNEPREAQTKRIPVGLHRTLLFLGIGEVILLWRLKCRRERALRDAPLAVSTFTVGSMEE